MTTTFRYFFDKDTAAAMADVDKTLKKLKGFKCSWLDPDTRKPLDKGDVRPVADVFLEVQSIGDLTDDEVAALLNMNLFPLTAGVYQAP